MKYSQIITFTKFTNLTSYAETKVARSGKTLNEFSESTRKFYAANRDVFLNVYVRYKEHQVYCKIQCPVSPLPVKGEFEVPNLNALKIFLENNGWKETNDVVIPRSIREEINL